MKFYTGIFYASNFYLSTIIPIVFVFIISFISTYSFGAALKNISRIVCKPYKKTADTMVYSPHKKKIDTNDTVAINAYDNSLMHAIGECHPQEVEKLLTAPGINIQVTDRIEANSFQRYPALHYAALCGIKNTPDYEKIMRLLLATPGINVNQKDSAGHVALYYLVDWGNVGLVQAFFDASIGVICDDFSAIAEKIRENFLHNEECLQLKSVAWSDDEMKRHEAIKEMVMQKIAQLTEQDELAGRAQHAHLIEIAYLAEVAEKQLQDKLLELFLREKDDECRIIFPVVTL